MKTKYYIICSLLLCSAIAKGQSIERKADSLQTLIEKTTEDTSKAMLYTKRAALFIYSEPKKAVKLLHESLAFSKKIAFSKSLAYNYRYLFNVHDILGSHSDSLLVYVELMEQLYQATGEVNYKVRAHWNRGIYYYNFGKPDKVIEEYLKALKLVREHNLPKSEEARLLGNLGTIFFTNNDKENALKYYQQAADLFEKGQIDIAITYLNMSLIYKGIPNKIDTALTLLNKAYPIAEQHQNYSLIVDVLIYKGLIHDLKSEYKSANRCYQEALELAEEHQLGETFMVIYSYYSKHYFRQKKYQLAIEYSNKSLELSILNEDNKLLTSLYELQDKCYRALGDYRNAYEVQNKLMMHLDSTNNTELQRQFKELQTEYEVEQKELENKLLKSEAEGAKKQSRNSTFIAIGSVLVLFLVGGWSFAVYHRNKERKIYNEELQAKNEALKTLDEAKTRFFSNISHEFKTPLTLIINPISRILKNNRLNDEDRYLAKSAEKNSLQLLDLTNQVLELTKFEVKKVTTHPIVFNLKQAANKFYADFESLAASRKILFETTIEVDEQLNIELDYSKFSAIVKNLISNAIKFTPENGQISLRFFEKKENIIIEVADTGQGIHVSDLPHIFDRYYQTQIASSLQEGGTGIGLAIGAEYTKLLGGTLQVKSEYGVGSTFILTLPKIIASPDAFSSQLLQEKNKQEQTINPIFQNKNNNTNTTTILIVEDNTAMQNYLRLVLGIDYQLEIAPHGKAALRILAEKHQDIQLIVSDVMMPEMNGYQLLEQLKRHPNYSAIPVIMLTALSGSDEKLKALRIGVDDYLTKPFVDEELLARVDNLLQNREERTEYLKHIHAHDITNNENKLANMNDSTIETVDIKDLKWLEKLEEYIHQHLDDMPVTDVIAQYMQVGRRTLYSKLKTLTGLTPAQYTNEIRFQTARKLIEADNNWTVKAIALKVGFKDEKNFSRNFKKRFGKYPSEYLV